MPFVTDISGSASIWPTESVCAGNYFISNYNSDWPIDRDDGVEVGSLACWTTYFM